jgi:hypothetical protein
MRAYNVVRFRVKAGREQEFIAIHQEQARTRMQGFQGGALIKTGERTYCFIGEWDAFASLAKARPQLIANLDRMRAILEDLGNGLGVTDPVSGEALVEF